MYVLANSNNIRFKNNAGAERNILTLDTNDDVQFGGSIDNIRFLTNEVQSDSIKIIVHKKKCSGEQNCRVALLNNSKISQEYLKTSLE